MSGMQQWAAPGMVAGYHLADVNDYSGNSRTLTNNNSASFALGKFGNCVDFGASNANKYLNVNSNLGITNKIVTIICWVFLNTEIASGTYGFISLANNTNKTVFIIAYEYNSGTRRMHFALNKWGAGDTGAVNVTTTLGTAKWYQIALTCDGTTLRAFINGAQVGNAAISGDGTSSPGDVAWIGYDKGNSSGYPSAKMDEVVFLSSALSPAEIRRRYAFQKGMLI